MQNGQELSEMFIGDDGLLSVFNDEHECEIIAIRYNIFFGEILIGKVK